MKKMKMIRIQTYGGWRKSAHWPKCSKFFAIRRIAKSYFSLTHVPSGLSVGWSYSYKALRILAGILAAQDVIDWKSANLANGWQNYNKLPDVVKKWRDYVLSI